MLVLSRQRDETIMIGDDIELTIVDIRGDKVRIGIKAPSDVPVHRKEVYDAIRRENEQAAQLGRTDVPPGRDRTRPPRPPSLDSMETPRARPRDCPAPPIGRSPERTHPTDWPAGLTVTRTFRRHSRRSATAG